ncbi:MAG: hypothetical protein QG577_832 [Thermodesulfobacteriota bacterium]|nr:hypothetical protein [Thermodesulfobacteriota bacterium]
MTFCSRPFPLPRESWPWVLSRSPGAQVGDIHVEIPRRGNMNLLRTIHPAITATKMRTSIIVAYFPLQSLLLPPHNLFSLYVPLNYQRHIRPESRCSGNFDEQTVQPIRNVGAILRRNRRILGSTQNFLQPVSHRSRCPYRHAMMESDHITFLVNDIA